MSSKVTVKLQLCARETAAMVLTGTLHVLQKLSDNEWFIVFSLLTKGILVFCLNA